VDHEKQSRSLRVITSANVKQFDNYFIVAV